MGNIVKLLSDSLHNDLGRDVSDFMFFRSGAGQGKGYARLPPPRAGIGWQIDCELQCEEGGEVLVQIQAY